MSNNEKVEGHLHELSRLGCQPRRFGFIIKVVRRFAWRVFHPFYRYMLFLIEEDKQLLSEQKKQLRKLESDIAALKNRCIAFENDYIQSLVKSCVENFSRNSSEGASIANENRKK